MNNVVISYERLTILEKLQHTLTLPVKQINKRSIQKITLRTRRQLRQTTSLTHDQPCPFVLYA